MALSERPSAEVLLRLRAELRDGRHRPGEVLSISEVAQRLGLSPTPVREALAHLAGEGLVHERRGQGYFAAPMDAEGLAERYGLHQLYLVAALQSPARLVRLPLEASDADINPTEALFGAMIAASGNRALGQAHQRLSDQLAPARRAEAHLWGEQAEELARLQRLFSAQDRASLLGACELYHLRRRNAASDLVALMRGGSALPNI